ncbi:MAG: LytTR family DNA-binding domain-containing protein [Acutalibacteraceae bacterium]|nr:LytTR family DNA-binding domain-containing protein [Acutalibacteraceae bacterium]
MKFTLILDKDRDEEIIIYAREKNELVSKIEKLTEESPPDLTGYRDKVGVILNPNEIYCFIAQGNKVYAVTEKEKLQMKIRLYKIEEYELDSFVKINQSCIANLNKIARFDTSVSGTLKVVFKNGYTDYVSRRNLKNVKERLGI